MLYLCICISHYAFGQAKDISGTYFSESGTKLEITGNKLNYIVPQSHSPIWYNDTLANCIFKWVDANFIELNSTPPDILGHRGLKVVQSSDSTINDSIKVSFLIPYQRGELKITIYTNTNKTFDLIYPKSSRELMIPNNVESISFYIMPDHIIPHTSSCLFYGIVGFDSFHEYQIKKNINHISIEIPAIDDSFFEKYYVKGDYAKISKDTITWKGEVFMKKTPDIRGGEFYGNRSAHVIDKYDLLKNNCTTFVCDVLNTLGSNALVNEQIKSNNLDKETLGWGMTFLHELYHTGPGGSLIDTAALYGTGGVVDAMNVIRKELNAQGKNFGRRLNYKSIIPYEGGTISYIPFDESSLNSIKAGIAPSGTSKFIKSSAGR